MNKFLIALLAVSLLPACGNTAATVTDTESVEESSSELSQYGYTYVTIRRDQRRCAAPRCGGYWVSDVNKSLPEVYVSDLSFYSSALEEFRNDMEVIDANETILRGRLSALDAASQTRKLVVKDAWRGIPGSKVVAGDNFYKVERMNTLCAPYQSCPMLECKGVNGLKMGGYGHAFQSTRAVQNKMSKEWIENAALNGEALVSGLYLKSQKLPAEATYILEAGNVFFKIPLQWSCPAFRLAAPPAGKAWSMKYSNGCVVPDRIVTPGVCPRNFETCGAHMNEVRFSAGANNCESLVCEPDFAHVVR
jgi:hypothetical protein